MVHLAVCAVGVAMHRRSVTRVAGPAVDCYVGCSWGLALMGEVQFLGATRPAPQTPRRDVAAWTPVCCAQPRSGAGASGASSLLSSTSFSPPFRTDPPRSPHLGHLRQNRFAYALCVIVRRSRRGRGNGGLRWRRRCFNATVRWFTGRPRRGLWLWGATPPRESRHLRVPTWLGSISE